MPELVRPNAIYKDSYLQALALYQQEGIPYYVQLDKDWIQLHFEDFTKNLLTEYWMVDGESYLGRLDINAEHRISYDVRSDMRGKGYGKLILQLGLQKAKELGIHDLSLVCDIDNIPSKKAIESQGGKIQSSHEGKNTYTFSS